MMVAPVITHQPQAQMQEIPLQPTAITTQPGQQAPGAIWMQLPPTIPGVPPGLEYLTLLGMVQIHQIKEMLEIMTGWEVKNKYVLKNVNEEQCYYAFEESECCERYCCGNQRGFVMHIVDNFKREVLTIKREFIFCGNCCGGCCAGCEGCQQECTVETPTMGVLGTVRQTLGCMTSNFNVMDASGRVCFEIDGPDCCVLMGCGDKEFSIRAANSEQSIGVITKKWGG